MIPDGVFSSLDLFFAERLLTHYPSAPEECRGLLALLMATARQGHVCLLLEEEKLSAQLLTLYPQAPQLSKEALQGAAQLPPELVAEVAEPEDLPMKPLCRFRKHLYLQKNWLYESQVLFHLMRLARSSPPPLASPSFAPSLNPEQQRAVEQGMLHPLSLITGGPGTGKTYTAAHLVHHCLQALPLERRPLFRVMLTAPTGKAVTQLEKNILKYLGEIPSLTCGTLHALLQVRADKEREEAPPTLVADLILIDECSMIDAALFARLCGALLDGTRLVLIGDPDQLPPVETGNFFADLIDAGCLPLTRLTRTLRMEQPEMIHIASLIQSGDAPSVSELLSHADTSSLRRVDLKMQHGSEREFAERLFSQVRDRFARPTLEEPDAEELLSSNEQFRILCCMRQGPFGVDQINSLLYQRYLQECPPGGWLAVPILISRNDYALQLYNGDTGFLVKGMRQGEKDYALFLQHNRVRKLSAYALPPFEYAYCLSVHKSQGSEYDEILLLVPEGSEIFGREVLYTAVTRARRTVLWEGSSEVIAQAVGRSSRKTSALARRFRELSEARLDTTRFIEFVQAGLDPFVH